MDLVSFLVPVYNVEAYLPKCLDSLVNQTWPNIEIILINDGSKDNSLAVARQYAQKYPQIKIFSYENSGISKTRNRALEHASGDYFMFVDSDDFIELNTIEVMMEAAQKDQLDFVQCGYKMDYRFGSFYRPGSGHQISDNIQALHNLSQSKYFNNYPWGKLYARHCFDGVRFPEDIKGFEDTFTIFKTLANARKAGTIPNRFYHYVQRRGSLTNRMSLETVYLMRRAYEYQQEYLQKRFPSEVFHYDLQQYNTDMVIIYTLIVFCKRKDDPKFIPADIDWQQLSFWPIRKLAYDAWLGIARLKLSDKILEK